MKTNYMAAALLMAWAAEATAQRAYTLDECVATAIENNARIKTADGDVSAAKAKKQEALTNFFPQVSAQGGGFVAKEGLIKYDISGTMSQVAPLLSPQQQAALAGMDPEVELCKNGVAASVTAMQPLYMGGRIVNGNRLAKVGEEVSRERRRQTEAEVRTEVEGYYWQIVSVREKLSTLGAVEGQLEQMRHDAEVAVAAGVRNRNDLLQVKLKQNDVRVARLQAEGSLSVLRAMLATLMGIEEDSVDAAYEIRYELPESPASLYQDPETALRQTPEYALLAAQEEACELQSKMTTGQNLPQVAVGGAYTYNNIVDGSANNLVGLVTVKVPLSDWWGGSRAIKGKRIESANASIEKQDKSRQLKVRMAQAWTAVTTAYGRLGIALESIEQSEENLRLNTDYYRAGTGTMSDMLDAQTLYQQSRDSYAEALQGYETAKRQYMQATGR